MSCGCNPWTNGTLSTQQVCGKFPVPEVPDEGQCSPYREKRDCEAPYVQRGPCPGERPIAIYVPGQVPPFRILTGLYDQNCQPITDENNLQITTLI